MIFISIDGFVKFIIIITFWTAYLDRVTMSVLYAGQYAGSLSLCAGVDPCAPGDIYLLGLKVEDLMIMS